MWRLSSWRPPHGPPSCPPGRLDRRSSSRRPSSWARRRRSSCRLPHGPPSCPLMTPSRRGRTGPADCATASSPACDVGSGDAQRLRRSLNAAADEVLTPRTHRPSGPGFNTISYCRSKLKATNCRLHLNSLLVDQHFVGLGAPGSNPTWSTFFKKKFAFFSKKQVYILYFHCGFHRI